MKVVSAVGSTRPRCAAEVGSGPISSERARSSPIISIKFQYYRLFDDTFLPERIPERRPSLSTMNGPRETNPNTVPFKSLQWTPSRNLSVMANGLMIIQTY